jgi:hypothetical protein
MPKKRTLEENISSGEDEIPPQRPNSFEALFAAAAKMMIKNESKNRKIREKQLQLDTRNAESWERFSNSVEILAITYARFQYLEHGEEPPLEEVEREEGVHNTAPLVRMGEGEPPESKPLKKRKTKEEKD